MTYFLLLTQEKRYFPQRSSEVPAQLADRAINL
jgi:hypothetical protein